jgi:MFS family permease
VISRMGIKRVIVIGLLIFAISVLMVTTISLHGTILLTVLPGTIIASLGANCAVIALSILATAGVADRDQGLASGLLNTAQQIGGALGVAATLTAATIRTTMLGGMNPGKGALIQGYQFGLAMCVGFLVVGALIALIIIRSERVIQNFQP